MTTWHLRIQVPWRLVATLSAIKALSAPWQPSALGETGRFERVDPAVSFDKIGADDSAHGEMLAQAATVSVDGNATGFTRTGGQLRLESAAGYHRFVPHLE